MPFRYRLQALLKREGFITEERRLRFIRLVQATCPEFGISRFRAIGEGQNPKPEEVRAMAVALGVHTRDLMDETGGEIAEIRRLAEKACERSDRSDLVEKLIKLARPESTSFRHKLPSPDDMFLLLNKLIQEEVDGPESANQKTNRDCQVWVRGSGGSRLLTESRYELGGRLRTSSSHYLTRVANARQKRILDGPKVSRWTVGAIPSEIFIRP